MDLGRVPQEECSSGPEDSLRPCSLFRLERNVEAQFKMSK